MTPSKSATRSTSGATAVLENLSTVREWQEPLYKDLHANPELSHNETRTAGKVADKLKEIGFTVHTGIGGDGVVGILENGDGQSVLLRADMDALPLREATGLPYASTVTAKIPRATTRLSCTHAVTTRT